MRIHIELDEKFYNNEVSSIKLTAKITPYLDKKHVNYPEAQKLLRRFRDGLMDLMKKEDLAE